MGAGSPGRALPANSTFNTSHPTAQARRPCASKSMSSVRFRSLFGMHGPSGQQPFRACLVAWDRSALNSSALPLGLGCKS
eukprot:8648605-Alexandrium_andersonii.AAC.1